MQCYSPKIHGSSSSFGGLHGLQLPNGTPPPGRASATPKLGASPRRATTRRPRPGLYRAPGVIRTPSAPPSPPRAPGWLSPRAPASGLWQQARTPRAAGCPRGPRSRLSNCTGSDPGGFGFKAASAEMPHSRLPEALAEPQRHLPFCFDTGVAGTLPSISDSASDSASD